MYRISTFLVCGILLLSFVSLAACGTDNASSPESESDPGEYAPTPASATQNDITTAVSAAGLDTLTRLLRETGLGDSLSGEGPYTLFAPSDLAFTQLPGGSPDAMSADELVEVLKYHIIPGRFETSSLAGSMDINSLQGGTVTFSVEDAATVRDANGNTANLESPDMNVDNGVMHIIDRVLLPGSAASQ